MQKKLLAAVVGGLLVTPSAFAAVVIHGRFADGVESRQITQGNSVTSFTSNKELRVTDASSRLIFSGSEVIGNGMQAWFQLDNRLGVDEGASEPGSGVAQGNTGVGLAGPWGRLTIGRWDVHYNELLFMDVPRASSLQDLQSLGPMSQVDGVSITNGSRTDNVVMWDSANMNGVTARLVYSTAPFGADCGNNLTGSGIAADNCKGDAISGALRYMGGPWHMVASYWTAKPESAVSNPQNEQKSTKVGVQYTIPVPAGAFRVGVGYDSSQVRFADGGDFGKRNAYMIPIQYFFGANGLYFTYLKMNKLSGASPVGTTTDTGAKGFMLGWDTALSKATSVGVYYADVKNDANADYHLFATAANSILTAVAGVNGGVGAVGTESKQIYFGLAHNF